MVMESCFGEIDKLNCFLTMPVAMNIKTNEENSWKAVENVIKTENKFQTCRRTDQNKNNIFLVSLLL
jgi:hypothetical protein